MVGEFVCLEAFAVTVEGGVCVFSWGPTSKDGDLAAMYRCYIRGFASIVVAVRKRTEGEFPRDCSLLLWRNGERNGGRLVVTDPTDPDAPSWDPNEDHGELATKFFETFGQLHYFSFSIVSHAKPDSLEGQSSSAFHPFEDFEDEDLEDFEGFEDFISSQRFRWGKGFS
jgi:hypothetical protein